MINGELKKVIRIIHYLDGTVEVRTIGNKETFLFNVLEAKLIFNRVEDDTQNI